MDIQVSYSSGPVVLSTVAASVEDVRTFLNDICKPLAAELTHPEHIGPTPVIPIIDFVPHDVAATGTAPVVPPSLALSFPPGVRSAPSEVAEAPAAPVAGPSAGELRVQIVAHARALSGDKAPALAALLQEFGASRCGEVREDKLGEFAERLRAL